LTATQVLSIGRKRRQARQRRKLREVEGFLDELQASLGEGQSTLMRSLEGYRRKLSARG
jgi:hypothetical protein